MAFKIEIYSNGVWTDDASLLGHGCRPEDNCWPSEQDARYAIDDLVDAGFHRDDLRVAEA